MNRSTIIYLGEQKEGNGRTIAQMLQTMKDSRDPLWWYQYVRKAMDLEKEQGIVDPLDDTQGIIREMNAIIDRFPNIQPVSVGSVNNLQSGITPPSHLVNYIFKNGIDLAKMWKWILDNFLPFHGYDYDWFGLLRFLADKLVLKDGINTTNTLFAQQMAEWFSAYSCTAKGMKLYRTGYLGRTPHSKWDKAEFSNEKRSGQTIVGFNHLNKICNSDLVLAFENDSSAFNY